MHPITGRLEALGPGPWIPVNRLQSKFNLAFAGWVDAGATLTWGVQHTLSPLDSDHERQVRITRSTVTATVFDPEHGMNVGDSVLIMGSGDPNLDGTFAVASVVDTDNYTYTVLDTGLTASISGTRAKNLAVFDHATITAEAGAADGNYAFPPTAIRFIITAFTDGALNYSVIQGLA